MRLMKLSGFVTAVMVGLGVLSGQLTVAANAQVAASSCADPVSGPPTGPATVSAASSAFGKVLVIGSGNYEGCSLYLLTSDEFHALSGAPFACSDNPNAIGAPCDSVLWPALLTDGAPIAGRGVNPALLGTVTRTDFPRMSSVQQVTYNGFPLYRFFLDEKPGETEGANLFDPVTTPTGIWYLVHPRGGRPASGQAHLRLETAPVGDTGQNATVLAVTMNNDFSLFPNASFPVYTLTPRRHGDREGACRAVCALNWPPVLTSMCPQAGAGVDQDALGTIGRPDGTRQVTYDGEPLYLFVGDAYIKGLPYGDARIDGAGMHIPWGVFNTIPPLP